MKCDLINPRSIGEAVRQADASVRTPLTRDDGGEDRLGPAPEGAAVDFLERNPDLGSADWLQGIYTKVVVRTDETPVYYRLDHGYNGGPALYYSTAVNGIFYSATQA